MIPSKPAASRKNDNPEDESIEHEWAEYNLPPAFRILHGIEDDDRLAFLRFGTEQEDDLPDGQS